MHRVKERSGPLKGLIGDGSYLPNSKHFYVSYLDREYPSFREEILPDQNTVLQIKQSAQPVMAEDRMLSWFFGQISSFVRTALIFFIILVLLPAFSIAAQVTMAWDPNDPTPDGYRIYQRTEGQTYDYSQPVWTGTDTTGTIDNLNLDITYYFVVQAYVGEEKSGDSNEISFLSTSPSATTYTISASTTDHGSISPSGTVTVEAGVDQTFGILPDDGYHVTDVLVDGVSIGVVSSYTFHNVAADHSITAEFAINTYTLLATTDTNGSLSPSGNVTVDHGTSQGFTITAAPGYRVADVLVDDNSVGSISSYQFYQVVEDHTIHATFVADTYTISAMAGDNGTITPSGNTGVSFGDRQTYVLTPNSGCSIMDVIVDGVSVGSATTYTFSDVEANHTIEALFALENLPPTADAGPDQTVDERRTVTLSGLNSIDSDDGIAAFQWHQIHGVQVTLNTPNEPETTFITPNVDTSGTAIIFELSVTDYSGSTSVDSCIVNVSWVNTPPVADAGVDQIVEEGLSVTIDASNSMDTDDGIVSYMWKQLLGPVVNLSNANSAIPFFESPDVGSEGASMGFEVTVTDAGGLQDTDTCLVNVSWVNNPPMADAGPDQQVNVGDEIVLDGSMSTDIDDDTIAAYRWRQTDGLPVELSDATAQMPSFIAPNVDIVGQVLTFELTVTDSGNMLDKDSCQVVVVGRTEDEADATPPVLSVVDPTADTVTISNSRINMSGSAWDDHFLDKVIWENNRGGSGVAYGTTNWSVENIRLRYGTNVITISALDASGNTTSVSKTVIFRFRWWW